MTNEIWKTKDFEEAKIKAVSEGKIKDKCEWCNAKDRLVPHHRTSFRFIKWQENRNIAISEMAKEQDFTFTPSALNKSGGFSTSKGYIKLKEFTDYIRRHPEFNDIANKRAEKEYEEFEDEINEAENSMQLELDKISKQNNDETKIE